MSTIIERESACNKAKSKSLQSSLRRLPDDNLKRLIDAAHREQKRRREEAQLVHDERGRWHSRRGLTKTDMLHVMRRSERSWSAP
jgi:hypothetical protein